MDFPYTNIKLESSCPEYINYSQAVEQTLSQIEQRLHNSDDPEAIIMDVLRAAAEFYDGDWAGNLDADLTMKIWSMLWWYNRKTGDMSPNHFDDIEEGENLVRWINALIHGNPIIISDTETLADICPAEYGLLKDNGVYSMIAVPFWKRPTGFLVVRNPKRYLNHSSILKMMAFVATSSINEKRLMDRTKMTLKSEFIQKENDILIRLFGGLRIVTPKGVITEADLNSPKLVRLIAYLTINSKYPAPIRDIVTAVWPEGDADLDGKNLKYLVYRLQRTFSLVSDYRLVESTGNGYRLNTELNVISDIRIFEEYWHQAQMTSDPYAKGRLLKKAMDLYKDGVLPSLAGEQWIMPTIAHYSLRYIGVVNQLLSALEKARDYVCIYEYANLAVQSLPGNLDAQYWLIYSMNRLGNQDIARNQLRVAEQVLTDEDYKELLHRLADKFLTP